MELKEYGTEDFLLNDSFVRYCLQSNGQDIHFWESWIQNNPDKEAETTEARKLLFSLGLRLTPEEKKYEFQKFKQLIEQSIAKEKQSNPVGQPVLINIPQRHKTWRWAAAAAAACLVFLAGYSVKWLAGTNDIKNNNTALAYTVYSTNAGERKTLELADGSSVILNSNSTLKIPSDFNQGKRNLQLKGEAFFDVAKNKDKPFIVSSKNVAIQAVGTSFKVRSYDFDTAMRVALVEGKVKVESKTDDASNSEVLLPGEELKIQFSAESMTKENFDISREINWKDDKLIFRDASLQQIAEQLEYWYGLKVNLHISASRKIRFNGEFINKDIHKVLATITYVTKLSYSLNNEEITITSK